ncbi:PEPxxWA-CTERM sorting domain-containing protein [Janthinobacterium sp. FW305-128]|uniref:PEPxxWA-CTERM sorting domain-containing protein n=1 Tax=Janthinobacterium sp. FW305-128 TaxID=2775055 RepID=UPI001E49D8D0|nr:PEPxxWA-CTERM sorting domain-containing protein [Janthinobacterium sp. FW305-128]
MTTPISFKFSLLLVTLLSVTHATVNAQNARAQPAAEQQKRCEAAGGNSAGGKANKNDDMDSTYSSCRLIDGYIGIDVRSNDGVGETKQYGSDEAVPDLSKPAQSGRTHSLGLLDDTGLSGMNGGQGGKGLKNSNSVSNIDQFTSVAAADEFPSWDGYHAPGLVRQNMPEDVPQLLSSASSSGNSFPAGSGVGGGGSGGGIDTGRNTVPAPLVPTIPAVPEPQTWAMLMAGLALLGFAARRKA